MDCCFSRKSSPCVFKNIRLVHLNGYVEEFEDPLRVSEVTGKPPKHFVFTHAQLLSAAGLEHLKPDTILEPGQAYFMLPYSTFQSSVSLVDLAPIARKLSAIAKNVHSGSKANSGRKSSLNLHGNMQRTRKSWKPFLSTIREPSFDRSSESDIQEKGLEKTE